MAIRIPQKHIITLPMGEYEAVVKSLDSEVRDFGKGDQEQVRWFFSIELPEGEPVDVPGWCSATFSNRSKLYAWTDAALGGVSIPGSYTFNSDDLVGRKVVLVLTVEERDDGSDYNKIHKVKPYTGKDAPLQIDLPF